ncbi:MAG: hypothetical protein HBSAPP03_13750 [Phycisphaerae bacterium]|nr:MAG: hypothetical protein HBSAPP03_13750 [Phycisphaerae bacterium]
MTINGSATTGGYLLLAVVWRDPLEADPGFPAVFDEPIPEIGCINFGASTSTGTCGSDPAGGLIIVNPDSSTDTSLARATRLAIAATGEISGDITVGQIFRMQAINPLATTPTGLISANVTAVGWDYPIGGETIELITAGKGITGNITAESDGFALTNQFSFARIQRVIVGPSTHQDVIGIQGDIRAEQGTIGSIFSSGPIDSATTELLKIYAGAGIHEIRVIDGSGNVLARDFKADIQATKAISDNLGDVNMYSATAGPCLGLIETAGDLYGAVRASSMGKIGTLFEPNTFDGIYARGAIYADITVDYNVNWSNIIGGTILGEVWIGRWMKGCVAATGGATGSGEGFIDGHIQSISIGRGDPVPTERDLGVSGDKFANFGPGLCGVDSAPFEPASADDWYDPASRGTDSGAIDGLIRAAVSIDKITIASVSTVWQHFGSNQNCKIYPPRIESPHIDWLSIDDFALGSVWSGNLDGTAMDDYYASIGDLEVGRMGSLATLWMRDWETAMVEYNMFGNIHVPAVPSDRLLQIGGILGDATHSVYDTSPLDEQICKGTLWLAPCETCVYIQLVSNDPRDPTFPRCNSMDDPRGQIWIHENEGLHGQVVINAANTGLPQAALWTGAVQVGETSSGCPLLELSPTPSSSEWESPHYDGLPAALGGGAVGLVPFALHRTACDPPADADLEAARTFLSSEFAGLLEPEIDRRVLTLAFYGHIGANHPTHHALTAFNGTLTTERGKWMTMDLDQDENDPRSRLVTITGNGVQYLLPGVYALAPVTESNTGAMLTPLVCMGTFGEGEAAPLAAGFAYTFELTPDCDANGENDLAQIAADPSLDLWPQDGLLDYCYWNVCDPDVNCDGNINGVDVEIMELAVGGDFTDFCQVNIPGYADGDFNRDGAVNGADVEDLENAVGGMCPW